MIDVNGSWIGFYTYGERYSESVRSQKIPFSVIMGKGIDQFIGRVTEYKEYGGIDEESIIKGSLNGNMIEFIKSYSRHHEFDSHGEIHSFGSENPTLVYYKGIYLPGEGKFKGRWEIPGLREDDQGIFHENNASGHWEMWKGQ